MSVRVTVGNPNTINTSVASRRISTKVATLADVDTANLEDGYTLFFNSVTNKWEAANPATEVKLDNIDGGTY